MNAFEIIAEPVAGRQRTAKGEQTRAHILQTALDLFRERGYEETTMRAIAERAGVALGNAYYYFESKEHLIQAFYAQSHQEHLAASQSILAREKGLRERLRGVLAAKIDTSEPYHRFSGVLFKTAADPRSPLNPFGPESNPVRQESTALMAAVLHGSNVKVPADLDAELPNLLWLYMMGIVLYWIHDSSPARARTYRLIDHTSDLVARTIGLASVPLLRPLRRRVLALLADLRTTGTDAGTGIPGRGAAGTDDSAGSDPGVVARDDTDTHALPATDLAAAHPQAHSQARP